MVDAVNAGQPYFSEPDLDMLLRAATTLGKLRATSRPEPADAFVIAVPTPFNADRSPNLDYIDAAVDAIAPVLAAGNVVILESTSPVGTTRNVVGRILSESGMEPGRDFDLCYCPERVLPGNTTHELVNNHRLIGGVTPQSADHAQQIYERFAQGKIVT